MRVFITGGTGLIGSHLVEELRAGGHDIVALHRRGSDTLFLEEQGCELVEGDVRDDAEDLAPLMEGCTHVVHAAALVYVGSSWPKVREINVDGTRNVLTASRAAGIGHAVHVSSVAVYGPVTGPVTEVTATDTDLSAGDLYARSKREAEEVARGVERVQGLPVSIVRPAAVYGERDRLFAPGVARLVRKLPVMPLMGSGKNTIPAVYAGNVAVALRLVLEAAEGGSIYDIGLDHPLTQRQLLEGLCGGLGTRTRFFGTPGPLIRAGATVVEKVGLGALGIEHLSLGRVVRLGLGENPYGANQLRKKLGWEPPHRHVDALRRTGRWLADHL